MTLQDLVSDFTARVNNAKMAGHKTTKVLRSKFVENICKKMTKLSYFESYELLDDGFILVTLNTQKFNRFKRMSKPGQRIYVTYDSFPRVINGIGYNIITSSKGILTHVEAKNEKLGGELILQVV